MLPWCSSAHSAFSVMPGRIASRICPIARSHTAMEWRMSAISPAGLDLARVLHHLEAVEDLVAVALHLDDARRRDAVDGDAPVAAAVLADHGVHVRGPLPGLVRVPRPRPEVEEGDGGADLVDGGDAGAEQVLAAPLEEHRRALGRHVDVADLVVDAPDLHVGRVDRVAGVDLVVEDDAGKVAFHEGTAYPPEPVAADLVEVAGRGGVVHRSVLAHGVDAGAGDAVHVSTSMRSGTFSGATAPVRTRPSTGGFRSHDIAQAAATGRCESAGSLHATV